MTTTARENAEERLDSIGGEANALKAIAWALLDLADAIRESHEPSYRQMTYGADAGLTEDQP